jgi:hypothetical protein
MYAEHPLVSGRFETALIDDASTFVQDSLLQQAETIDGRERTILCELERALQAGRLVTRPRHPHRAPLERKKFPQARIVENELWYVAHALNRANSPLLSAEPLWEGRSYPVIEPSCCRQRHFASGGRSAPILKCRVCEAIPTHRYRSPVHRNSPKRTSSATNWSSSPSEDGPIAEPATT